VKEDSTKKGQRARDRRALARVAESLTQEMARSGQLAERPVQAHFVAIHLSRLGMNSADVDLARRLVGFSTRERLGHAVVFAGPNQPPQLAVDVDVTRAALQRLRDAGFSARTLLSVVDEVERVNTRESQK